MSDAIFFAFIGASLVMLVRLEIVFRARMRALDMVSAMAKMAIDDGRPWAWLYEKLDKPGFDAQMLDLTKWTFPQFFPWLAND